MTLRNIKYDNINRYICGDKKDISVKGYLRQCLYSTNIFFKLFKSIIAIHTDKGNGMIILNKDTYHKKMDSHILDGKDNGTYAEFILDQKITTEQQTIYKNIHNTYRIWINNIKKHNCKNIPKNLLNHKITQDYNFYAASIYGTIKVHKADYPIRPIVADFENPLRYIQKLLKLVLNQYIDKERFPFIINNTKPIIYFCHNTKINSNHRLATLDYASMYTNINLEEFYHIIINEFDNMNIINTFCISKKDLISLFKNMIQHFTYIQYKNMDGHITHYKQNKGIPMGGSLSYHISEVVTARHFETLRSLNDDTSILRIFKYVDDILIICKESFFNNEHLIEQCLNQMKYELVLENDKKHITFLNLDLNRCNSKIYHQWYCKTYASHRTIDFLSAHPWHIKYNTMEQLYSTIMETCSTHKTIGTEKFINIAKINHYPRPTIKNFIYGTPIPMNII